MRGDKVEDCGPPDDGLLESWNCLHGRRFQNSGKHSLNPPREEKRSTANYRKNLEGGTPSQSGGRLSQPAESQRHVSSPSAMTVPFLLCLFGTSVESWDEGGVKALKVKFLFGSSSERLAVTE